MRQIKSNFFISLDGAVESPDQWHFPATSYFLSSARVKRRW
ncbi:MAG: hypothetical protein ACXWYS_09485 [Gaiellaceae bacterium]